VLGVTGSIAAYKAADLTSQLTKQGCQVHVVLTAGRAPVYHRGIVQALVAASGVTDLYDEVDDRQPTAHQAGGRGGFVAHCARHSQHLLPSWPTALQTML